MEVAVVIAVGGVVVGGRATVVREIGGELSWFGRLGAEITYELSSDILLDVHHHHALDQTSSRTNCLHRLHSSH